MRNCVPFNLAPNIRKTQELGDCVPFNLAPRGGAAITPEIELLANDGALLLANNGDQLLANN